MLSQSTFRSSASSSMTSTCVIGWLGFFIQFQLCPCSLGQRKGFEVASSAPRRPNAAIGCSRSAGPASDRSRVLRRILIYSDQKHRFFQKSAKIAHDLKKGRNEGISGCQQAWKSPTRRGGRKKIKYIERKAGV